MDGGGDRGGRLGEEGGGVGGKETLGTHSSTIATSKPNPTKPMGLHFQSWDI